jgi:ATP synthase protein I
MPLGFGKSDAGMMRTAWDLSAGMLSLVVAIALGWWFGGLLDSWFGTSPWLMLLFLCFGVAAGVLNVYRAVSHAIRDTTTHAAPGGIGHQREDGQSAAPGGAPGDGRG